MDVISSTRAQIMQKQWHLEEPGTLHGETDRQARRSAAVNRKGSRCLCEAALLVYCSISGPDLFAIADILHCVAETSSLLAALETA